jgi:hypothetical protein
MPGQLEGSVAQSGAAAADARPQISAPAPKLALGASASSVAEASGQRFFTRCMRELVALVRTLLSYPMFIILSTTANKRAAAMRTPLRAFLLNMLCYGAPFLAISQFSVRLGELGDSANYMVWLYIMFCLVPVCASIMDKILLMKDGSQIPTGTFCFRPAYRFRNTLTNWLAVGSVLVEFAQMAFFCLPAVVSARSAAEEGGGEKGTAGAVRKGFEMNFVPSFETQFWACFGCAIAQQIIIILRVLLKGQNAYAWANSVWLWQLVYLISGPLYIAIVVCLIRALDCDYTVNPARLQADPSIECWSASNMRHGRMVMASYAGLAIYLPQATLLPSGTYKETMRNMKIDVLYVPLYLQAHFLLKALFCTIYAIHSKNEIRRTAMLLLISLALLLLNEFVEPCSVRSINVLRTITLACCVWVGMVSLLALIISDPVDTTWLFSAILSGWACLIGEKLARLSRNHSISYNVVKAISDLQLQELESTTIHPRCLEPLVALSNSLVEKDIKATLNFVPVLAKLLWHKSSRVRFQACWCLTNLSCIPDEYLKGIEPAISGDGDVPNVAARRSSDSAKDGLPLPRSRPRSSKTMVRGSSETTVLAARDAEVRRRRKNQARAQMFGKLSASAPSKKKQVVQKQLVPPKSKKAVEQREALEIVLDNLSKTTMSFERGEVAGTSTRISSDARHIIAKAAGGVVIPRLFELARGTEVVQGRQIDVPGMLKVQAFATLINLASNAEAAAVMACDYEVIPLLVNALRGDPFMGKFAALGLANLAQVEAHRQRIRAHGGLSVLAASALSKDVVRTKHACIALANMSLSDGRFQNIFLASGVIERLVKLSYKADEQVRDHIGVLLCYLAVGGHTLLLQSLVVKGVIEAILAMRKRSSRAAAADDRGMSESWKSGLTSENRVRGVRTASIDNSGSHQRSRIGFGSWHSRHSLADTGGHNIVDPRGELGDRALARLEHCSVHVFSNHTNNPVTSTSIPRSGRGKPARSLRSAQSQDFSIEGATAVDEVGGDPDADAHAAANHEHGLQPLRGIMAWDSWPSSMDAFSWMRNQDEALDAFVITEVETEVQLDLMAHIPGNVKSKFDGLVFSVHRLPLHGTAVVTDGVPLKESSSRRKKASGRLGGGDGDEPGVELPTTATTPKRLHFSSSPKAQGGRVGGLTYLYTPEADFEGEDRVIFKAEKPLDKIHGAQPRPDLGKAASLRGESSRAKLKGGSMKIVGKARGKGANGAELLVVRLTVFQSDAKKMRSTLSMGGADVKDLESRASMKSAPGKKSFLTLARQGSMIFKRKPNKGPGGEPSLPRSRSSSVGSSLDDRVDAVVEEEEQDEEFDEEQEEERAVEEAGNVNRAKNPLHLDKTTMDLLRRASLRAGAAAPRSQSDLSLSL